MSNRYPVLQQSLNLIREISPGSVEHVIDVGAQRKTEFLMDVFPDKHHHLFEPVTTYHKELEENYNNRNISFTLHKIALSNVNGNLYLHNTSNDGSGRITHSQIRDEPDDAMKFLVNIEKIETKTLDYCFPADSLSDHTYLIKMDVDGVEEKIIEGAQSVMSKASFVIIEASLGRRDLCSRAALIEKLGFRIFDICDNAYYFGQLALVDMILINNDLRNSEIKFRPWEYSEGKVIWKNWQHGFKNLEKETFPNPFEE